MIYVIHKPTVQTEVLKVCEMNKPHSTPGDDGIGSLETDLIMHAKHSHARFKDDLLLAHFKLEESMRGTPFAASLKPCQKKKDGRGTWKAIVSQHAGKDKWQAKLDKCVDDICDGKWKGNINCNLSECVSLHCNLHVSMERCTEHTSY